MVAGARPAACDVLLAEREAIVVVAAEGLSELAAAGAATLGPPVHVCSPRARPLERALARSGVAAVGELARGFAPAARALA